MHSVRKQILDILKECGGATVAELAGRLNMAPVSVRHHLDILQGENLIQVERLARKGNVGRPQQIYALTAEASQYFPNNFPILAANLVDQIKQILPPEQVDLAFQSMARNIADEAADGMQDDSLEDRLQNVTEFLNQHGYLSRWEAAGQEPEDGYLLHKHNCPYAGISGKHAELCLMDQTLVNELVGQPCERIHSMADDGRCCTYRVSVPIELTVVL